MAVATARGFDPRGWTLAGVDPAGAEPAAGHVGEPLLRWCHLAGRRLTAPFFEGDLAAALAHPFNRAFDVRTPMSEAAAMLEDHPPLPLAALVFHVGRCGSTLVTQLLAADPTNRVVSEPAPLDRVLRAPFERPATADEHVAWIRTTVGALAQPAPGEARCVVKLDSWALAFAGALDVAFPGVPWLFVVRDPLEVLVSLLRSPPMALLPGAVPSELFGVPTATAVTWPIERYAAHVQATLLNGMAAHLGRATVVDHAELPAAVVPWLEALGLPPSPELLAAMHERTAVHAKFGVPYEDDRAAKHAAAGDDLRALAEQAARPAWRALLADRVTPPRPG